MAEVVVRITRLLADIARTERSLTVQAETAGEALTELCTHVPALHVHLYDDAGQVRPHVNIFVRDELLKGAMLFDAKVGDGDEVAIVQAVSGGSR